MILVVFMNLSNASLEAQTRGSYLCGDATAFWSVSHYLIIQIN